MQLGDTTARFTGFVTLATFVLVVTVLLLAQDVMMPIALAVLLAFLLSPLVVRFTRWGLPRIVAILTTVTVAFSVLTAVGWVVTTQVVSLMQELPKYEENIHAKIVALKNPGLPGPWSLSSGLFDKLRKEIQAPEPEPAAPSGAKPEQKPVPVEVRVPKETSLQVARDIVGPILGPLGTAGIVIVFVIAMLFQREDLRDRFIKVVSAGRLNVATQAVDDAARRVSRYLAMQLVVNAAYGIPIGIGLYWIGIPNALLWGLLATLLRFIPFLGPWIAAAFPLTLAIAVDPGSTKLLYTLGLFVVMEVVSNNVVEVWLYGASTGISNLALMVAAVFWTWLWGPAGLFLSTPLTVCLMVLGKYVPGLKFLSVLLGSDPVLESPAQFYQRMLAMDSEEMLELATKFVEERSLVGFYDEVFIPALILAEADRHSGALAEVRQKFISQASRELIEELERRDEAGRGAEEGRPRVPLMGDPVVLGVPAHDDADEIVALMLRHLLRGRGISTEVGAISVQPENARAFIERDGIQAAYISALPPAAMTAARQMCRRLQEQSPGIRTLVGVWSRETTAGNIEDRLRTVKHEAVATSLGEALVQLEKMLVSAGRPLLAPIADHEQERIKEVERLGLLAVAPEELFDAVTRDLAQVFQVPISLVSIIDTDRQFWKTHIGLPDDLANVRAAPRDTSIHGHVVISDEVLVVEDTSKDKWFENNAFLTERGVRFYAGAPLRARSGHVVGSLCVLDTKPRQITPAEKALLHARAAELMEAVEARGGTVSVPGEEAADENPGKPRG